LFKDNISNIKFHKMHYQEIKNSENTCKQVDISKKGDISMLN